MTTPLATHVEEAPRSLRDDQRGAMLIIGVMMCGVACGFLWYIIGIGNAMLYRESLQDSADAIAFTGAAWHAHGMQVIVAMNLLMTALMAILVLLRALETILLGVEVVCTILAAIPWTAAFGNPCRTFASEARKAIKKAADELDDAYEEILPVLNQAARGLSIAFPYIAEAKALLLAQDLSNKNVYNGGIDNGLGGFIADGLIPRQENGGFMYGLPIEEDTKGFKGHTGDLVQDLMEAYLGGFGKVAGGLFASGADALGYKAFRRGKCECYENSCGNSPAYDQPEDFDLTESGLFDEPIQEACDKKAQSCQGEGDSYEFTYRKVDKKTGEEYGPELTETGDKKTLENCSATVEPPEYDERCTTFGLSNSSPKTCPTLFNGDPNPEYEPSYIPPVQGVYECWDTPGICSLYDTNGERYKIDDKETYDNGLDIEMVRKWRFNHEQCVIDERKKVKEEIEKKEAEEGGDDDNSGGGGSGNCAQDCESPKKLFCGLEAAGEETFQIRSFIRGKPLPLHARKGVGVAAPGKEDVGLPLTESIYRIGFAQSEYYYNENNWNELGLWNFKWRARLRAFHTNDNLDQLLELLNFMQLASDPSGLVAAVEDYLHIVADCEAQCLVDDPLDTDCYGKCFSDNAQLPINRFQIIH